MIHEFVDMDTKEKIRYISESSNTSGYSTVSPGPCGGGVNQRNGNTSPGSVFSMPPSPALSPATTALQAEFSNLNLPSTPQANYGNMSQHNVYGNYVNFSNATSTPQTSNMQHPQFLVQQQQQIPPQFPGSAESMFMDTQPPKYTAELHILEQPVEKFRFRYKSEMHGTHGSLNGASSKRTPKTYPEVELRNFPGKAIIRCSLFQTNLESPHSHQLVVRKDDTDICDPHNLEVSPETGFVAQFQNMGIIHTAKKFIFDELVKKKKDRLCFELGREELSTKELLELHKQTEKEAKDMNLNQVRLCFEAFKIEDNNTWSRIAAPVYTHSINNRKSAQTGELRIVRSSIAVGSVQGGDDLILLVEKVSKKNIKVRFFEENEDGEEVWEAWGKFRESDVHHQYAIVCQTPAYHNKDIDKVAEVNIELLRPTDDERSYPPVTFRYKPRDVVASRKRRRTFSTATSSSGSSSSLKSEELPKTVQQVLNADMKFVAPPGAVGGTFAHSKTISEEFDKNKILQTEELLKMVTEISSEELQRICAPSFPDLSLMETEAPNSNSGQLQFDGVESNVTSLRSANIKNLSLLSKLIATTTLQPSVAGKNDYLQRIFKIYDEAQRSSKPLTNTEFLGYAKTITELYTEHAEKNENNDSIIHDIIISDNAKVGIKTCHILKHFELSDLLNRVLNAKNESGLHYACLYERPLYIRPLLGLSCDPTIEDHKGNTALHVAVREQHSSCVDSFLNVAGLRLNLTQRNHEGETALHLAIRLKNFNIAKKLLQHEPAAALVPNCKDGNNALHMAVYKQSLPLVHMILDLVFDKNSLLASKNTAGYTALDLARMFNTKLGNEIVTQLASNTIDISMDEMIIKQEQSSSSSNEDDDDTEDLPKHNLTKAEIKVEESDAEDDTIVYEPQTEFEAKIKEVAANLADILNDAGKLQRVANMLNKNSKWREVANKARLGYLLCVLTKAEQLLTHVRAHSHIDYIKFVRALAEVDSEAFNILLSE